MIGPGMDARERFLREIAERIPVERIAEIHLFAPLRSGGRETGVAVIAAYEAPEPAANPEEVPGSELAASSEEASGSPPADENRTEVADSADQTAAEDIEGTQPADVEARGAPPETESTEAATDSADQSDATAIDTTRADRLVVYKATYRWTRKGPDRGRWEVDVTAEADAPLEAVAEVVRGVQRRAGDDSEPELISQAALMVALSDRPWAAAL